jgi:hypothetical protein
MKVLKPTGSLRSKNSLISILAHETMNCILSLSQSKRVCVSGAHARLKKTILTFGHNIVGGEARRLGGRRPRPPGRRGRILAARPALHLEDRHKKYCLTYFDSHTHHAKPAPPSQNKCERPLAFFFFFLERATCDSRSGFNETSYSRFLRPGVLPNSRRRGQININ